MRQSLKKALSILTVAALLLTTFAVASVSVAADDETAETKTTVYSIPNNYKKDGSGDIAALGADVVDESTDTIEYLYTDGYIDYLNTSDNYYMRTGNNAGFWINDVNFSNKLTNIRVAIGVQNDYTQYTPHNARFECYVNVDGVDYNIGYIRVKEGTWGDYLKNGEYSYDCSGDLVPTALLSELKGKYDVKLVYTYDMANAADIISGVNFAAVEFSTQGEYNGESIAPAAAANHKEYTIEKDYATDGTNVMNGTAGVSGKLISLGNGNAVTIKNVNFANGLQNVYVALGTSPNPAMAPELGNANIKVYVTDANDGKDYLVGQINIKSSDEGTPEDLYKLQPTWFGVKLNTWNGYYYNDAYYYGATKSFEPTALAANLKGTYDVKLVYEYTNVGEGINFAAVRFATDGTYEGETVNPSDVLGAKTKVYSIANDYSTDYSKAITALGKKPDIAGSMELYVDGYVRYQEGNTYMRSGGSVGIWIKDVDFSSKLTNIRVAVGMNPEDQNYASHNPRFDLYVNIDGIDYSIGYVNIQESDTAHSWGDYIKDGEYSYQHSGNLVPTELLSQLKGKYDVKMVYTYDRANATDHISGVNVAAVEFSTYGDYTGESVSPATGTPAVYSIEDNYSTDGTKAMSGTTEVSGEGPHIPMINGDSVTVKNVSFANGLQNVYAALGTAPDPNQCPENGNAYIKVYVTDANDGKDYLVGQINIKSTDEGRTQDLTGNNWGGVTLNTWTGYSHYGSYYYAATKNFEPTALAASLKGTYDVKLVYEYTGAANSINFAAVRFVSDGTYEGATVNPSDLTKEYTITNDYKVDGTGTIVTNKLAADGVSTGWVSNGDANFRIADNVIPNVHGSSFIIKGVNFENGLKNIKMSVGTTAAKTDFAGKVRYQVAVRYNGTDYPIGYVGLKNSDVEWAADYSTTTGFTAYNVLSTLKGTYDVVFTANVSDYNVDTDGDYQMTVAAVSFKVGGGTYEGETVEPKLGYSVTLPAGVTADKTEGLKAGDVVTLTVTSNDVLVSGSLRLKKEGEEKSTALFLKGDVEEDAKGEGTGKVYKFVMPDSNVVISAKFKAESAIEAEDNISLIAASVNDSTSSLRFRARVNAKEGTKILVNGEYYNIVDRGIVMLPEHMLGSAELVRETENALDVQAVFLYDKTEEYIDFTCGVSNLPDNMKGTDIKARAYIVYNDGEKDVTVYCGDAQASYNGIAG